MTHSTYTDDELVAAAAGPVMDNDESFALIDEWDFGGEKSTSDMPARISRTNGAEHDHDKTTAHEADDEASHDDYLFHSNGQNGSQAGLEADQPHFTVGKPSEQDMDSSPSDPDVTNHEGSTTQSAVQDVFITAKTSRHDTPADDQSSTDIAVVTPGNILTAPTPRDLTLQSHGRMALGLVPGSPNHSGEEPDNQGSLPTEADAHQSGDPELQQSVTPPQPELKVEDKISQSNCTGHDLSKTPMMQVRPISSDPSSAKGSLYREMRREENRRRLGSSRSTPEVDVPALFQDLATSKDNLAEGGTTEPNGFEEILKGSSKKIIGSVKAEDGEEEEPATRVHTKIKEAQQLVDADNRSVHESYSPEVEQPKTQTKQRRRKNDHGLDSWPREQSVVQLRSRTCDARQEAVQAQTDEIQAPSKAAELGTALLLPQSLIPKKRKGREPRTAANQKKTSVFQSSGKKRKTRLQVAMVDPSSSTQHIITSVEATSSDILAADDGGTGNAAPEYKTFQKMDAVRNAECAPQQRKPLSRAVKEIQDYWNTLTHEAPSGRCRRRKHAETLPTEEAQDTANTKNARTKQSAAASKRQDSAYPVQEEANPEITLDNKLERTGSAIVTDSAAPTSNVATSSRKRSVGGHLVGKYELSMLGTSVALDVGMKTRTRALQEVEIAAPPSHAVKGRRQKKAK